MLRASEIIQMATELVAKYGEHATAHARARSQSATHDPKARAVWEQVAHAINVITDFDFQPIRREAA
jgi:hypothetical protein